MEIASIFNDLVYKENKPAIKVLFETDFTKEIRIAMKKGQIMKEHKTAFPIVVEIVDGIIDFGVKGDVHSLKKGDLISLTGNVPHDLKAQEDSIVRLTLSKFDKTERVENVVKG
ncbi:MAG: cupin domain-containing protein [Tenacibaculum sp.]|nr:cupin domain-containing protein [Tenacibaculum sp.]